ncbi:MAG: DUF4878 domain-containing protein [Sulfuricurvum sp.]|nr:DUF4878 domain-containing protein [Sulfuricurvum sp.]
MTSSKILLSLVTVLMLSGCSQSPESSVASFYDNLKSGDVKSLQAFLGEEGAPAVKLMASISLCPKVRNEIGTGMIEKEDDQEACLSEAYTELEYEIVSADVSEDGETATVKAKSKYMGKEEEKTFNLIKTDDEWKMGKQSAAF